MKTSTSALTVLASALLFSGCSESAGTARPANGGWTAGNPNPNATGTVKYADGTYQAEGPFASPIGRDGIVVKMTLANGDGTIAGLSIRPGENTLSMNAEWMARFSTDIRKIVGKKISEIESLGGVSGSTLTYKGFMTAVEDVRSQASR